MTDQTKTHELESTEVGPQHLIDGVRPISVRDRLAARAARPMQPKRLCVQKPCDIGLFDEGRRNQLEMF